MFLSNISIPSINNFLSAVHTCSTGTTGIVLPKLRCAKADVLYILPSNVIPLGVQENRSGKPIHRPNLHSTPPREHHVSILSAKPLRCDSPVANQRFLIHDNAPLLNFWITMQVHVCMFRGITYCTTHLCRTYRTYAVRYRPRISIYVHLFGRLAILKSTNQACKEEGGFLTSQLPAPVGERGVQFCQGTILCAAFCDAENLKKTTSPHSTGLCYDREQSSRIPRFISDETVSH